MPKTLTRLQIWRSGFPLSEAGRKFATPAELAELETLSGPVEFLTKNPFEAATLLGGVGRMFENLGSRLEAEAHQAELREALEAKLNARVVAMAKHGDALLYAFQLAPNEEKSPRPIPAFILDTLEFLWDQSAARSADRSYRAVHVVILENIENAKCFAALRDEYASHQLSTPLHRILSEASLGKAYLKDMGVEPFLKRQGDIPRSLIGKVMGTYYGGRAEVRWRRTSNRHEVDYSAATVGWLHNHPAQGGSVDIRNRFPSPGDRASAATILMGTGRASIYLGIVGPDGWLRMNSYILP